MDMLTGGKWVPAASGSSEEITSPFDGTVAGTVPVAGLPDVDAALAAAQDGAATWRRTPAHERMRILLRAAELADERAPEIARLISTENGKAITEAVGEAGRPGDLIRLSAFEGAHLYGDSLPLDANRGTGLDKIGFTVHRPCGVVAGIFTGDVSATVRAIREIDAGSIHINWTPLWRADLMPYGGLKSSGIGKEGPRSAVAEMTEAKTVVLHGQPW